MCNDNQQFLVLGLISKVENIKVDCVDFIKFCFNVRVHEDMFVNGCNDLFFIKDVASPKSKLGRFEEEGLSRFIVLILFHSICRPL
jgi:hypothetical protein